MFGAAINDLAKEGLVAFEANPDRRKARLRPPLEKRALRRNMNCCTAKSQPMRSDAGSRIQRNSMERP